MLRRLARHVIWVSCAVVALCLLPVGAHADVGLVSVNIEDAPRPQPKWGYSPTTVRVPVNTWVTWSNAGSEAHSVTAVDGSFDSGELDPSDGFSWYFSQPGVYPYVCSFHPWMKGQVVVGDAAPASAESPAPAVPVPSLAPAAPSPDQGGMSAGSASDGSAPADGSGADRANAQPEAGDGATPMPTDSSSSGPPAIDPAQQPGTRGPSPYLYAWPDIFLGL